MSSSKYLDILIRYSSLLTATSQVDLSKIKTRKASAPSYKSHFSEFPGHQIIELGLDVQSAERHTSELKRALGERKLIKEKGEREIAEIERGMMSQKREYVTVKRQRRLIEKDILKKSALKKVEGAYFISIVRRIRMATALCKQERNAKNCFQKAFRVDVEKHYSIVKRNPDNKKDKWVYFVVTKKWYESCIMKVVYIVPKALESNGLSRLFWHSTSICLTQGMVG